MAISRLMETELHHCPTELVWTGLLHQRAPTNQRIGVGFTAEGEGPDRLILLQHLRAAEVFVLWLRFRGVKRVCLSVTIMSFMGCVLDDSLTIGMLVC